jgi:hypothetical protein
VAAEFKRHSHDRFEGGDPLRIQTPTPGVVIGNHKRFSENSHLSGDPSHKGNLFAARIEPGRLRYLDDNHLFLLIDQTQLSPLRVCQLADAQHDPLQQGIQIQVTGNVQGSFADGLELAYAVLQLTVTAGADNYTG